ncbi:MAG: MBL fold metallo-hydrolase [Desulfobulbaceae bacterium]|jgi:metallo-beta-lactamase family protein|nr:MBL fold metallo-hydrolase [Desulfobulbaceae bacterium]
MTIFAQFFGATHEVTGSFHLIHTDKSRILLDCGLFQGRRKEAEMKNRALPLDPAILSNCVLSHAHLDHCGRIPMLVKGGFSGRIFATATTADACAYLLKDSAKIQENDAAYLNYKIVRNFLGGVAEGGPKMSKAKRRQVKTLLKASEARLNDAIIAKVQAAHHLERIEPIYTIEDVEACLPRFFGQDYRQEFAVADDVSCTLYDAGHILGSAMPLLSITSGAGRKNILFSGDVGRFGKPIIRDPTLSFACENIDLLIMESTYGDRRHDDDGDLKGKLKDVLRETFARSGSVIIPAFAYGRTQELIYFLHELYMEGAVRKVPVYIDSPLATNITHVFDRHPENYDSDTRRNFLNNGIKPFAFEQLRFVESVEESMAINRDQKSHIVIAGSGMCEGGRVLHHLRHKIHDEKHTILIVGYMGRNTFGHLLQEKAAAYEQGGRQGQAPTVRFYNKEYPLRARVATIGGFSAHGDYDELLRVIRESNLRVKKIALVHGEEEQISAFQKRLQNTGYDVVAPRQGESVEVP